MIELALPAGTLENALVAFEHGADAVYFGLKDFSARKGAGNFSFEDLSKIREYSLEHNKKTYITINTLIDDSTLPRLYEMLDRVSCYGTDGIICQDLGVARLIRKDFGNLPLHASTQLAVHTINGVKALQRLGFSRVVLSRELNLKEIERIRKACPDVELKVFIHGALCYGFSGLCMASFLRTGRSANEGSCAQVCRTWFKNLETGEKLYPFSLKDMDAGLLVKELERIGIDSLKVEGRLKGNEYVAAVADYYRAIIDDKPITNTIKDAVATSFQRISCNGYLDYSGVNHKNLNTGLYTGHIGEKIGYVLARENDTIRVKAINKINPYDGLMILKKKDGLIEPIRFSSHILKIEKDIVIISFDRKEKIDKDSLVYRISNSSSRIKAPSLNIAEYKPSVDIDIVIDNDSISVNGKSFSIAIYEGHSNGYEEAIKRIFTQSGDFQFKVEKLSIANKSRYEEPFMRLSELKRIRRDAYSLISIGERASRQYMIDNTSAIADVELPRRALLSSERLAWNTKGVLIDGIGYITIPPVAYDEEALFREIEDSAEKYNRVRIGLNNIAHIEFAKTHPEYEYFADIYLYLSNRESARLLSENIPNLIGGYLWLERKRYGSAWPFLPTIVEDDFEPPLFISRSCFRHDSLNLDCNGCSRHNQFRIEQNGNIFDVAVDNCQTVVSYASDKGRR